MHKTTDAVEWLSAAATLYAEENVLQLSWPTSGSYLHSFYILILDPWAMEGKG